MSEKGIGIDDKTSIPLFAVIAIVPAIVGGVLWLASVDAKASTALDDSRVVRALILDVRERIIRLETILKDSDRGVRR